MNKYQKEIELTKLSHEQKAFQELRKTYTQALADTKVMVKKLQEDINILEGSNLEEKSILQSRIYQLNYQKAMEEQLTAITNVINSKNVTNVQTFLTKMYQDSYLGVNYNLQKSGIPIIMAANPSLIVKSINTPTNKLKFSETLYERTKELKKAYKEEISRGIATGKGYKEIAKQLDQKTQIGFNNAYRIARTEGGRVSSEASMTAMRDAKSKGADIVKQWLATLDMRTRDAHGRLDGQIREVEEDFEIDGYKAQCPHGFGYPEMDINCRCAVLSVPRWDVEDTNIRYDDKHNCLIESKNYEDWKKGYYVKIEENPEVTKIILEAEERIKGYKTVLKEVSDKVDKVLGKTDGMPKNFEKVLNAEQTELQDTVESFLKTKDELLDSQIIEAFDNFNKKSAQLETKIAELLDKYDFNINCENETIINIFRDGKIKNQFETGTSKGLQDGEYRKTLANRLFGTELDTDNANYEKYGYLGDSKRALHYGNVKITLKKDKLKNRTTFTFGDSLDLNRTEVFDIKGAIPSSVVNPSVVSLSEYKRNIINWINKQNKDYGSLTDVDFVENLEKQMTYYESIIEQMSEKGNLDSIFTVPYVELQFHGQITLDDIEKITVPKTVGNIDEIKKVAKELGIKVEVVD